MMMQYVIRGTIGSCIVVNRSRTPASSHRNAVETMKWILYSDKLQSRHISSYPRVEYSFTDCSPDSDAMVVHWMHAAPDYPPHRHWRDAPAHIVLYHFDATAAALALAVLAVPPVAVVVFRLVHQVPWATCVVSLLSAKVFAVHTSFAESHSCAVQSPSKIQQKQKLNTESI